MTSMEIRALMALEITSVSSCIRPIREPEPGLSVLDIENDDDFSQREKLLDRWGDRHIPKEMTLF